MTKLITKVKRETHATYRGRAIMVELRPPDLIVFRLKKTKKEYPLSVSGAFNHAVKIEALAQMQRRKEERKRRKEGI